MRANDPARNLACKGQSDVSYTIEEVRAHREALCSTTFIIVCEPGMTPITKRGSLHDPHGEIVMLQLLRDYHPSPETRLLVATVPEGGKDLWVMSEREALSMFKGMAGRRAKRHVKDQLAKERAASWHNPPLAQRKRRLQKANNP
jgi:hypothetical protein